MRQLFATPTQFLVREYINFFKLGRYGTMTELKIDSKAKTLDATVMLKGESSPISIRATYDIADGPAPTISVTQVSVSREWMNVLANDFLINKAFAPPASIAKILRLVL